MVDTPNDKQEIIDAYRQRAPRYDLAVRLFDIFAWFGFNISGWRKQAISELGLKAGDTVVDIGCGTGLNFPLLYRAVGPQGTIIGVDLSDAMLAQARQTAEASQWANVQLVCADASQFKFPPRVDSVLSTYALTLVPGPGRVVSNAIEALTPGGRLVVLDMAWPRYCPLWWRHVLPKPGSRLAPAAPLPAAPLAPGWQSSESADPADPVPVAPYAARSRARPKAMSS